MKRFALLFVVCAMVFSMAACGKNEAENTVTTLAPTQPTTQPTTAPQEPDVPQEVLSKYNHYGLYFALDDSYTLRQGCETEWYQNPEYFYFYNDQVSGTIRCRWNPAETQTSKGYAQWCGGEVDSFNEDLYYSVLTEEATICVQSLFRYGDYSWEFTFTTENEEELDGMLEILEGIMVSPSGLSRPGEQTVQLNDLSMELPVFFKEAAVEGSAMTLRDGGNCVISVYSVPGDDQELARAAQLEMDKNWDNTALYDFGLMSCVMAWKEGQEIALIRSFRDGWQVDISGQSMEYMLDVLTAMSVEDAQSDDKLVFTENEFMGFSEIENYICPSEAWEGRYTVDVLGLGTQVMLHMYGVTVEGVTAFGRTLEVYFDNDEGSMDISLTPYGEGFIMGSFNYEDLVILPEGSYAITVEDDKRIDLTVDENGQLRYYMAASYVYFYEQSCILDFISNRYDFYDQVGTVEINDGALTLNSEKTTLVSDHFDLDAVFEESQGLGLYEEFDSLDAYFESKNEE